MDKTVKLKDGSEVRIRPIRIEDLDMSFDFFQKLPEEDRIFLRVDVTDRALVEQRIRMTDGGDVQRLVAIAGDMIVADGALELAGHGWKENVGELRVIVARPYQRKGLGMLMARELYQLAVVAKVEEMLVKMMRPQVGAQKIFHKLGFRKVATLPEYVKDVKGNRQDLVVMRCPLSSLWESLDLYFDVTDWRGRAD